MTDPVVVRTRTELAAALAGSGAGSEVDSAVVMTMGALHEAHAALMRVARATVGAAGRVIVTIFVNPLQFGPGEDLDRYPRTLDDDLAVCAAESVDVVFVPERDEMYPGGEPQTTVDPGPLGRELEGAARPTHFAGVLTVVNKLLNLLAPTYAVFGEKDYQQLTLVTRMVTDFELPYRIVGAPTVREPDGLARSSRNRYLGDADRKIAVALSMALTAGVDAAAAGREAVLRAARDVLDHYPDVDVDYLVLRTTDLSADASHGAARLLVAARVGTARLLDNVAVALPPADGG